MICLEVYFLYCSNPLTKSKLTMIATLKHNSKVIMDTRTIKILHDAKVGNMSKWCQNYKMLNSCRVIFSFHVVLYLIVSGFDTIVCRTVVIFQKIRHSTIKTWIQNHIISYRTIMKLYEIWSSIEEYIYKKLFLNFFHIYLKFYYQNY
jgi:hypothetical protein